MQKQTKVYDYNANKVQDLLLRTLKQRGREATVTDLVTSASLPRVQVEEQLASISDEFGARLKVTESGEVLYSFPNGFKSRYTGFGASVKRFSKAALKFLEVAGTTLFKAWIMVMLVGYFALFVTLLILALVASIAISMSSKSDERSERSSGGFNGFALTGRLLELFFRIWFYSEVFKDPYQRDYERNRNYERAKARGPKRPLHKAVFSFVFGETDPNAEFDAELRKALISFVQAQKGIISMDEFSALCGLDELEAGRLINRYLLELEGSPEVSDAGTLYFSFPKLMLKADRAEASWPARLTQKKLNVFSANPKGMNFWFAAINAVNILFGSFFAVSALTIGTPVKENVNSFLDLLYLITYNGANYINLGYIGIFIILGLIPLSFGVLFYAIPLLRMLKMQGENAKIKKENLARVVHRTILANPLNVELVKSAMSEAGDEASREEAKKITERIAGETQAEVSSGEGNNFHFVFTEIERRKRDIEKLRSGIDLSRYNLGKTIFDSHETN